MTQYKVPYYGTDEVPYYGRRGERLRQDRACGGCAGGGEGKRRGFSLSLYFIDKQRSRLIFRHPYLEIYDP
ncbi:hypothetical protein J6590_024928 [Homalodisca vitripennis]|nr:hypothetical protein J6590_024928 [Homalodisca vitripennis]